MKAITKNLVLKLMILDSISDIKLSSIVPETTTAVIMHTPEHFKISPSNMVNCLKKLHNKIA